MTTHTTPSRLWPPAWIGALALLVATAAPATVHQVDFGAGCKTSAPDCSTEVCVEINASSGDVSFSDTIEAVNHGGVPVTWDIVAPPTGCTEIVADQQYDCNGVIIDASVDPMTVAGTPGDPASFTFGVEGDNGTDVCAEGFELIITADSFDIVLVLDRSGSMAWDARPGVARWTDLTDGVNGFTSIIETSDCVAGSRFGMTLFATQAFDTTTPNFMYNDVIFHDNLFEIDSMLSDTVFAELDDQSPLGWTAMGDGLATGIANLSDNAPPVVPAPPERKRVVLLFTDGEQNQLPEVSGDGTMINGTPVHPGGGGAFELVSVGVGQPDPEFSATLQALANANGTGQYIETNVVAADIAGAVDGATQSLLDGCSPQMVATYSGPLAGTVGLQPFDLNRKVSRLLIKTTVSTPKPPTSGAILPGIQVERDGADVTQEFDFQTIGTNTLLLVSNVEIPPAEGSYTIELTQPDFSLDFEHRTVVFADDKRLDMDWGVSPAAPRAEQPFEPRMSLSWFSAPVTGATVEALVLEPGEDIGDLLARNDTIVDVDDSPDAGSPGLQKFRELLKSDADFLSQILPEERQLTLADQGDGSYTGSFNPGDISGTYQVFYRVSGADPATFGRLQRTVQQSVYVRFGNIDMAASPTTVNVDGNTTVINFRPMTTYGRFVGPAAASAFSITGPGVTVDSITDLQDGTYKIVLSGDPGAEISVDLLGEEIYSGPAGEFGEEEEGRPGRLPRWLLWLILLIILLILIWALKKVFS